MRRDPSRHIVILTGAGVSAESGLHTFRDSDGIWATFNLIDVATPTGFSADPARVHAFYNERRRQLLSPAIRPNRAHEAIARLERAFSGRVTLITQNVDDLHERAGSAAPIHMHGELLKARCTLSGRALPWRDDLSVATRCPCCGIPGMLRPHVVWFGEVPLELGRIHAALSLCGLFIAIGTSGSVHPAAGFVRLARGAGARTVEMNLKPTEVSDLFDETLLGPATGTVPLKVDRLIAGE